MDFRPIRTKKIYQEIVDQIRDMILTGDFSPGDKLPSEREMADMLGVSRPSVREAITALAAMGVLDVRPGEGTFVAHTSDRETIESLALILAVEKRSLAELMEVRRILECEAAVLAAQRATTEDIELMSDILADMESTVERREYGVGLDLRFHFAIGQATHNQVLHRLINTLDEMMHQTFLTNRQEMYANREVAARIIGEHQAILKAITERDPEGAREGMLNHLNHVEQGLERM